MTRAGLWKPAALLAVALTAGPAAAISPVRSPHPEPRVAAAPEIEGPAPRQPTESRLVASPRPPVRARSSTLVTQRPAVAGRPAAPTGALCGDATLRGAPLPEIEGRLDACGIAEPVRISHVDGVALSQPATIDCGTARALSAWVRGAVRPAVGGSGGGLSGLRVVAHYTCRTRNNRPGAKVSEHGKGRAIDIAALRLGDGSEITVLDGWRDRRQRRLLKKLHAAACGSFGTVLGPDADRHHQDHFHLDTARYRSRSYCR